MRFSQNFLFCVLFAVLAGCGGGGGSSVADNSVAAPGNSVSNVMAVTVELGPSRNVNIPYVTITVCAPGSETNCKTIDHVLVDTGSNGLRIFASALSSAPALALPSAPKIGSATLAACTQFADGSAIWGPVKLAAVKLAGHRVDSLPVHVVGDASFAAIPASCSNSFTPVATPAEFGANAVLGIGDRAEDCGERCTSTADNKFYYACTSSSCTGTTLALERQVTNPVALFASDNNGVLLKMPAVAANGATGASGSLIFGIATRPNNALGEAKVFNPNPSTGYITTAYKGRQYAYSFIDSGSNAIYFDDSDITVCSNYKHGFYCPPSKLNLTAAIVGDKGNTDNVAFSVENADQLFTANSSYVAFTSLAGPVSTTTSTNLPADVWFPVFDWGLPFFYGRNVFTAIKDRDTPAGKGPYYAY